MADFQARLQRYQQRIDAELAARLPATADDPTRLSAAMRYATVQGGKRIRPVLTLATAEALGVATEVAAVPACAVEYIHAYSLVHDDLPAMDDDDLRRGQPTVHRKFDEATAILAGDALQNLAVEVLCQDPALAVSVSRRLAMIHEITSAAGHLGMVKGQMVDLESVGKSLSLESLEMMHRRKTGSLIRASVRMGALCDENLDDFTFKQLDEYAVAIGLGFQIVDDILDVVSDTATLGKTQGADASNNKPTYPALLGLDGARKLAGETHQQALAALAPLPESFLPLRDLADFILNRTF